MGPIDLRIADMPHVRGLVVRVDPNALDLQYCYHQLSRSLQAESLRTLLTVAQELLQEVGVEQRDPWRPQKTEDPQCSSLLQASGERGPLHEELEAQQDLPATRRPRAVARGLDRGRESLPLGPRPYRTPTLWGDRRSFPGSSKPYQTQIWKPQPDRCYPQETATWTWSTRKKRSPSQRHRRQRRTRASWVMWPGTTADAWLANRLPQFPARRQCTFYGSSVPIAGASSRLF